ncbi:MAG: DUF5711 family protein [Clostridiales bacterium]|nr:DUF5711 family protein [Clostridiales bacterium]MCD8366834.1 DUF5711 family protein [Clostridiales bacterium]
MTGKRLKKKKQQAAAEKKPLPIPVRVLVRLIAIIVTCLMVLGAVLFIVYRDTVSLDGVVRYILYRNIERDEAGEAQDFTFSADAADAYAMVGDNLVICATNSVQVYSLSGSQLLEESVQYTTPVALSAGDIAVVYDLGGNDLMVIQGEEIVFSYSTETNYAILGARLNDNGYLTVIEEAAGYKEAVTVFDEDYDPVLKENISSAYVMDALVSPDNGTLALITIGQEDTSFASYLELYECATGEKLVGMNLGTDTVLDLYWTGDTIRIQTESGVMLVDGSGTLLNSWSDSSQYLQNFAINGLDFSVELMGKYKAGSMGQLMVIDENGDEFASRAIKEEVLSVSVAGRYIAVLTANQLMIFTRDLDEYASIANGGETTVLMRTDGSAMLIGDGSAHLYVP